MSAVPRGPRPETLDASRQPVSSRSMYTRFFGLKQEPFSLAPDPRYLHIEQAPTRGARPPALRRGQRRRLRAALDTENTAIALHRRHRRCNSCWCAKSKLSRRSGNTGVLAVQGVACGPGRDRVAGAWAVGSRACSGRDRIGHAGCRRDVVDRGIAALEDRVPVQPAVSIHDLEVGSCARRPAPGQSGAEVRGRMAVAPPSGSVLARASTTQ